VVDRSVRGGALGFSSSWGSVHSDHLGNLVPSRYASRDEVVALASVLVFAAGITTGGLLSTMHVRHHFLGPPQSGEIAGRMREHLRRALDLTPEQSAKIGPIIDETSAKLEAIRVESAQRIRSAMAESEKQIAPQLTPEQEKKLQNLKERHKRMLMHHGFMLPTPEDASPAP